MPGPSKTAEALVALIVPPACREEILGDLYERYQSPARYYWDAIRIVPFMILSRIRRTSDAQIVLMEAISVYAGFLGAALMTKTGIDTAALAIPTVIAVMGARLADAYAKSYGPGIGLAAAIVCTYTSVPHSVLLIGCTLSFVAVTGIRLLFASGQMRGIHVPASWLKSEPGEAFSRKQLAGIAICLALAVVLKLLIRR